MTDPSTDWTSCSVVEVESGKMGGAPVIKDTRLSVTSVTDNYDSYVEPKEIARMFSVSLEAVEEVLRFRQEQLGDSCDDDAAMGQDGGTEPEDPRHGQDT